jgi:hypothetical protein
MPLTEDRRQGMSAWTQTDSPVPLPEEFMTEVRLSLGNSVATKLDQSLAKSK